MDRHRKPTKRSFSKNFPSGTPSASSSQPPYPWPTTSSQQSLAGSSTELPQPPPFMSFLPPPPFPIPMTSAFASTPSPMMPIFSPMIMPSGPFLPGQAPFSPFSIPPPNMPMSFPPPSINTAISDSTSNLKLEMISPPDSEKSERKRKRKAEKQESKEKERKKKKPKFVSKALTLGELVQEAKQRKSEKDDSEKSKKKKKKKEKDLESYLESASTLEEENALLRKADELPPVTEHDYDEININDEGEQFDPNTVKVPISRRRIRLANSCDTVIGSEEFEEKVLNFAQNKRASQPQCPPSIQLSQMFHNHGCRCGQPSDESDDDSDAEQRKQRTAMENKQKENIVRSEIDRKRTHPAAISSDICFNEPEMANDGPICKCSQKAKQGDMRHGYYPGEQPIPVCNPKTRNPEGLYHYVLIVNPPPASLKERLTRTKLIHENEFYFFEGFSLILHRPLPEFFPRMPISHWSSEYEFHLIQEEIPENTFTIHELEVFYSFVFDELLELADVKRFSPNVKEGCPFYHVMPRFVAKTMERGETYKLLPMRIVLKLISENFRPLFTEQSLNHLSEASEEEFKNATVKFKQQLLFRGDKKPTTLRADNFFVQNGKVMFDHQTNKPSIYVSGHNPILQALQRRIHKMKHLHSIKGLDPYEQSKMDDLQKEIEKMRNETCETRRVTVQLPCEGYFQTGLFPDVTVHAILLLLATHHVRYHCSLEHLETRIGHRFQNRGLLELSLTHPSFKNNFGTNADHAKNTLTNCAYRKKYTGEDKKDKKRGIHVLMNIMSQQAQRQASGNTSHLAHNERLEYLGDAVVEMIASSHLYFMLPHHNEGGLATYRSALVQNRNLANLAKNLRVDEWLLFAHQGELCHEADFRHAMANTFEALIAAIYLDSNLNVCDRIFSDALWSSYPNKKLREIWDHSNEHILKREYPEGDRHLIEESDTLKKLTEFEKIIHVKFQNIRLLAKAFTRRSIPYNELTKGHNQRLEWLGDSVLQLVVSDYLYKHFPLHHEGHLSLLRTSLVSNKTQSTICDELCMREFVLKPVNTNHKIGELRLKDKADLVEAVIGALFVDRGWIYAQTLVRVLFLPRLKYFIESNRWNDPKSRLQQMCLTLRHADSRDPDMPEYKVLQSQGSTNSRVYTVAVYFRKKRLAEGRGGTIHEAQMEAARKALSKSDEYFPHIKKPANKPYRRLFNENPRFFPPFPLRPEAALQQLGSEALLQRGTPLPLMSNSIPPPPPGSFPFGCAPPRFFSAPPPTGHFQPRMTPGLNYPLPMLPVRIIEDSAPTQHEIPPPPPPPLEDMEVIPEPPPSS